MENFGFFLKKKLYKKTQKKRKNFTRFIALTLDRLWRAVWFRRQLRQWHVFGWGRRRSIIHWRCLCLSITHKQKKTKIKNEFTKKTTNHLVFAFHARLRGFGFLCGACVGRRLRLRLTFGGDDGRRGACWLLRNKPHVEKKAPTFCTGAIKSIQRCNRQTIVVVNKHNDKYKTNTRVLKN